MALTEVGMLVEGLDLNSCSSKKRHDLVKVGSRQWVKAAGLNMSYSQNSAEMNLKKSVSSDGDLSKLRADVLKFMQKQEKREL